MFTSKPSLDGVEERGFSFFKKNSKNLTFWHLLMTAFHPWRWISKTWDLNSWRLPNPRSDSFSNFTWELILGTLLRSTFWKFFSSSLKVFCLQGKRCTFGKQNITKFVFYFCFPVEQTLRNFKEMLVSLISWLQFFILHSWKKKTWTVFLFFLYPLFFVTLIFLFLFNLLRTRHSCKHEKWFLVVIFTCVFFLFLTISFDWWRELFVVKK